MIRIEIPIPPKRCHPNSRGRHWASKARAMKDYRGLVRMIASRERPAWPLERAVIRATFHFGCKRRRDPDNLLASLKGAFDGLVDAGILADDHAVRHEPIEQVVAAKYGSGFVVLEVSGVDDAEY